MTDVPTPAVSRSPRRLYCCCVNTGASSLTSSTYTITCRSQTRGGRSRWGGDLRSPGLALLGLHVRSLFCWASGELPMVNHQTPPPGTVPGMEQGLKHHLIFLLALLLTLWEPVTD